MVPTRYERHHNASARGTKERGIDLQTNSSPYSNTNTASVRTSIRHRTRTHRTARKKSSITARFRLLFPPFLSSPNSDSPLDSSLTCSLLVTIAANFNALQRSSQRTWCHNLVSKKNRKIYGLKNRDKNRERRIKEEREGGRKRGKKREEKLKGRKKKKKERNNPTRDDNAITHAIYPESTRIHTDYLTLATVAVAVMGRNQAPPFNIPSGTRFANR